MSLGDYFSRKGDYFSRKWDYIKENPGKAALTGATLGMLGGVAMGPAGAAVGAGAGTIESEKVGKGVRDTLFGKEEGGGTAPTPASLEDVLGLGRRAQSRGLTQLLGRPEPTEEMARLSAERDIRAQRGSTADAQRRVQEQTAQRGLGQSSIGIGANAALQREQSDREGLIRASIPERLEALRTNRINQLIGTAGSALGTPGYVPGQLPSVTTPGILPLLTTVGGGVAGGIFGGPAGASAGAKIGAGVGQYGSAVGAKRY